MPIIFHPKLNKAMLFMNTKGHRLKPMLGPIWKIMKLTAVFLVVLTLQVSAHGYSQKINLNLKRVPISRVFKEIHKQTGFDFFYNTEMLKQIGIVSVRVSNADLPEVLDQCLSDKPLLYTIVNNTIILSEKPGNQREQIDSSSIRPELQDLEITGTVTDAVSGLPLAGASVNVKGGSNGTSTSQAGSYKISVPAKGAVLTFSFVGYETAEVKIAKAGVLNVALKVKVEQGEEIVIMGYGTQKRKEVTSAVVQVSGKEILKSQSVTVSNSLAGKVPGLIINQRSSRPGADGATYYIRGISTYKDASALIVVDGVANRDGIDRVDPNDIESVTVLKDASAAIYGAQSANGVILITTKRGGSGKPKVNYSFNNGFVSPVRVVKMADAATYARGINDLAEQQGQAHPYSDQTIADYVSGKLPSTNWYNEEYRKSFNQQRHSLTLSGGNESVKYFLSGGTTSQGSIIVDDNTSKYRQYNFRSNVDVQVNKRLVIGLDLSGRRQNSSYTAVDENGLFSSAMLSPPTLPAFIDGKPAAGRGGANPVAIAQGEGYDKTQYNLLNGTIRAEYKIPYIKGLSVDGFGAVDYGSTLRAVWSVPWFYYEKDASGQLQKIQRGSGNSLTKYSNQANSYTLHAKIKYNNVFNQVHAVNAFVAVENSQTRTDNLQASRSGFISTQIDQLFAGSASNQTNTGLASEGARLNYFGRAGYTYNNKYLLQFQFRYDGSHIFPASRRFGFFPGVSAGWVISEEKFLKDKTGINNLKLRASYGILGNDRINQFQYLNLYTLSGNGIAIGGQDVNVINPGVAANPNVTWEKKKSLDIGIEGRLLNNKISFEVDYFRTRTEGILSQRNISIPTYTGLNQGNLPDENIGIVDNNGIDGQINYRSVVNKDISFNIGANFTYAKNKLVFIDEGDRYKESYQKAEGKPYGSLLIYDAIGIYRTQADIDNPKLPGLNGVKKLGDAVYRDVNGDGKINSDDRIRSDYSNTPQIQYGFLFGVQYKGLDLSGNFMGQARAVSQFDYVRGEGNNTAEYFIKNAWSPSNINGSLPRLGRGKVDQGEGSTFNTRSVSFLRLKNIELGYNIPKAFLNRVGIQGLRVYINAYNILTFDKLKKDGLQDPDQINSQGWVFPQTKSVNLGVNVNL